MLVQGRDIARLLPRRFSFVGPLRFPAVLVAFTESWCKGPGQFGQEFVGIDLGHLKEPWLLLLGGSSF